MSKYFIITDRTTPDDLRRRYKALCKQYHPDCGGSDAVQAQINVEYQQALRQLAEMVKQKDDEVSYEWLMREMERHWKGIVEHVRENRGVYEALWTEMKNPIFLMFIPQKYRKLANIILCSLSAR